MSCRAGGLTLQNRTMSDAVHFDHVSKRYRIGRPPLSLKTLLGGFKRRAEAQERYHWALRDVDFALQPGQSLGIIGPNGAGKTTILKLLSKVTHPTSGRVVVNGRYSSLIELGAGFHPDLTGRENVYLNGIILGMRRAEIARRFDDIVQFAGIGQYLDTPVKRYSSGMYARLGFAVAAHVDPEVLIVDEVLAVGDMAFRRKCYDRMAQMIKNGTTLVLVTHDFSAVQRVTPRCLVMYRGQIAFDGPAPDATAEYSNILRKAAQTRSDVPENGTLSQMVMTHAAVIEGVKLLREDGTQAFTFAVGETVHVRVQLRFHEAAPAPVFACSLRQPDGQTVYDYTTGWAGVATPTFEPDSVAEVEFTLKLNLVSGTYQLGVDLAYADLSCYYDRMVRAVDFVVVGRDGARGVADLGARFGVVHTAPAQSAPQRVGVTTTIPSLEISS